MGTLNFTVGEDFGTLLTNISREKLTHEYDLNKAVEVITGSLIGSTREQALQIISGEYILSVDEATQEVLFYKSVVNKFDLGDFIDKFISNIESQGALIFGWWGLLPERDSISSNGTFNITLTTKAITDLINKDSSTLFEEVTSEENYLDVAACIKSTKSYLELFVKADHLVQQLNELYSLSYSLSKHVVTDIITILADFSAGRTFITDSTIDNNLEKYLEATREISIISDLGIKPVNIDDNYSAGWLSPEGDYYALNGEMANMLHLQIADMLQDNGIIPDDTLCKDSWLESNGWIKIHGNWILFGGYSHPDSIVHVTDKQQKLVTRYGQICHAGVLKVGFKMERISAAKFGMIDELMLKKLFEL